MNSDKERSIEQLGTAWFSLIKNQAKVFALESELAHLSLFPLLMSMLAQILLSLSLWLSFMALVGFAVYQWKESVWLSLSALVLINLTTLLITRYAYHKYRRRMRFEQTRSSLKELLH